MCTSSLVCRCFKCIHVLVTKTLAKERAMKKRSWWGWADCEIKLQECSTVLSQQFVHVNHKQKLERIHQAGKSYIPTVISHIVFYHHHQARRQLLPLLNLLVVTQTLHIGLKTTRRLSIHQAANIWNGLKCCQLWLFFTFWNMYVVCVVQLYARRICYNYRQYFEHCSGTEVVRLVCFKYSLVASGAAKGKEDDKLTALTYANKLLGAWSHERTYIRN